MSRLRPEGRGTSCATTAPAARPLLGGLGLLTGGRFAFRLPPAAGPLASWTVTLPAAPALVGIEIYTQAIHYGGTPLALSNACDLHLGN